MKKEIEVKILNIDPKKFKAQIKKLGAKKIFGPELLREIYFESPAKKQKYSSFRLRSEGKKCLITLKMQKASQKYHIRDEYEIEVNDFENTKTILELAGFKIFRQREKMRESYKIKTVRIDIDTYPQMNPYAEIEASNENDIQKILKKLEIPLSITTNKTSTQVIKEANLNPNKLLFNI